MKALVKRALQEASVSGTGNDGQQNSRMSAAERLIADMFSNSPSFSLSVGADGVEDKPDWSNSNVREDGSDEEVLPERREVHIVDDDDERYVGVRNKVESPELDGVGDDRSTETLQRQVLLKQMQLLEQQEALLALRSVKNRKSIELLSLQVNYMKNKMSREGLPVTPPPGDASQE